MVKTCCNLDSFQKSTVAVRVVTNVVLWISDAEIVLTAFFMYYLVAVGGGINLFLCFVLFVGFATYLMSAIVLAPRQKNRVGKLVRKFMQNNSGECNTRMFKEEDGSVSRLGPGETGSVCVTLKFFVYPPGATATDCTKTFEALDIKNAEDNEDMQRGLTAWGLSAIWDAQEVKNAWNCMERKHAVPFFRLARFGFMAQPTPKDLGGILNANALFSFCCGLLQVIFGAIRCQFGLSANVMVPLIVSSLSLIISTINVVFNFAGKLAEIECEERLTAAVMTQVETTHRVEVQKLESELKQDKAALEQDFAEKKANGGDVADLAVIHHDNLQKLDQAFALRLRTTQQTHLFKLENRLAAHRRHSAQLKQVILGTSSPERQTARTGGEVHHAEQTNLALDEVIKNINEEKIKQLKEIASSGNTQDLLTRLEKVTKDADDKVRVVQGLKTQAQMLSPTSGASL